jgi:Carboxypeptidase regulatory-like domain
MRRWVNVAGFLLGTLLLPSLAQAQASITGVVKDTSGAILPGVTVEVSSAALIEKTRSVATDVTGQYRIVDLRPGVYSVTFALAGFTTVKREGVELAGSFIATVNADLRVGALAETVTVSGQAPTVDVQSTTKQRVMDQNVISTLPTSRGQFALGALIPGASTALDVGGSLGFDAATGLTIHGSKSDSQRLTLNGIQMNAPVAGGYGGGNDPSPSSVQEFTIDYSAISAESFMGGVRINFVPKDGGNTFRGVVFAAFANDALQGDNLTQDLRDRGLVYGNPIDRNWDFNPGFGGPIKRDRLWFYASFRSNGSWNFVPGMFFNKNTNNPNAWTYEPDTSRPISRQYSYHTLNGRVTWQASPRHKFTLSEQDQAFCECGNAVSSTTAPEAGQERRWPVMHSVVGDWSAPLTSRLLVEGVLLWSQQEWTHNPAWQSSPAFGQTGIDPQMISVTDQGGAIPGLLYRSRPTYLYGGNEFVNYRAALSYVTGAHAMKIGFNGANGRNGPNATYELQPVSYRFNNGVPNQLTERADFFGVESDYNEPGFFAQDRWTMRKWTLTYGVRYDHYGNEFPEQTLGPAPLFPDRNVHFPEVDNLRWHDITPRLGAAYDLFGNGRTAVKVSLGKYLQGQPNGVAESVNPINALVTNTTRTWLDANRDYVAQCDLLNPLANGECQAMANSLFGSAVDITVHADPDLLHGFGKRNYNWEFSSSVQHQVAPNVSVDVGYFRRWYGNVQVADNLTVTPADFTPFSITAPVDPRLPDGGGYVISSLYDLNPSVFGRPGSYLIELSDKVANQTEHWNGVDGSINLRLTNQALLQGGLSTGRTSTDACAVRSQIGSTSVGSALGGFSASNADSPSQLYCRVEGAFRTQVKLLGSYTFPYDIRVAATFQSLPGPSLSAIYNAPFSNYGPSLGRVVAGGNVSSTVSVNLIGPDTLFGERHNQLDLRFSKRIKAGRTQTSVGMDLYNALNSSTVLSQNNNYAAWQVPTSIVTPRFAKFNVTVDF